MRAILAVLLLVPDLAWAHHPMMPPPAPPPVVAPPTVTSPAAASSAPVASSAGTTVPWLGIGVAVGTVVFAWLAICQLEEERDPAMHKLLMCPKTPDWKQCSPFSQQPC